MRKIFDNRVFSLRQLILSAVVFSAIVFSNGEGISLLPFSNSGGEVSSEKKFNAYTFSVHGANGLRNQFVSKDRKNSKAFSLASSFSIFHPQNILTTDCVFQGQDYRESIFPVSSDVLSVPSDRAPPQI